MSSSQNGSGASENPSGGAGADTFVSGRWTRKCIASRATVTLMPIERLYRGGRYQRFVSAATDCIDTTVAVPPDGVAPPIDFAVLSGITSGELTVMVHRNNIAETLLVA
jgi:hypothetical protein